MNRQLVPPWSADGLMAISSPVQPLGPFLKNPRHAVQFSSRQERNIRMNDHHPATAIFTYGLDSESNGRVHVAIARFFNQQQPPLQRQFSHPRVRGHYGNARNCLAGIQGIEHVSEHGKSKILTLRLQGTAAGVALPASAP